MPAIEDKSPESLKFKAMSIRALKKCLVKANKTYGSAPALLAFAECRAGERHAYILFRYGRMLRSRLMQIASLNKGYEQAMADVLIALERRRQQLEQNATPDHSGRHPPRVLEAHLTKRIVQDVLEDYGLSYKDFKENEK